MSQNGVDGMLNHEKGELDERVACLENKLLEQANEIICLKSALADAIKRITTLEADHAAQNSVLPSKMKRPMSTEKKPSRAPMTALDNAYIAPQRHHAASRKSPSPRTSMKKWSSADLDSSSHSAPAKRSGSIGNVQQLKSSKGGKQPTWSQDEGCLKIYLKGRSIPLFAPSDTDNYDISHVTPKPNESLQLEWVYGYRGRDCRSNLFYLPTGEIVYFIAATVVLYNVEEEMQRHYLGHTDDIKCLSIHPDKIRVATGQVAGHDRKEGKPHVRIWDSVSLNTLQVIGIGDFDRAVACIGFSKLDGGQFLVAVDDANEHVISVWDISKDKVSKITETKSSTEPVLAVEYHPSEKNQIVSCGKSQLAFWTLEGGTLAKKLGLFDKYDKPKFVLCLAYTEEKDLITGDSNGNIFVWGGNRISHAMLGAHDGGVFSLCVMKDGSFLSGGGKDRKIIHWTSDFKRAGEEVEIEERFGPVRTLSQGKGNLILVGTTKNCILQGTLDLKLNPIVQGHVDELWGLATHPTQHQFLTGAYDKHLHLWDALSHSVVWSIETTDPVHCCCFHPTGNFAAIGTQTSRWQVVDLTSRDIIVVHNDGNEQIETVQYSPDGQYLALGSRDNHIYVYQVSNEGAKYSKVGKCSGHSSFITHLDWSADSKYLVSNSGDYEILYWNAASCKQVTSQSTMRDVDWATQYCVLGFKVAGVWPEGADGTDVNACTRSHNATLLVSADDYGKVNLMKYPCSQPKATASSYGGHSSHVTNAAFIPDDTRLLTTGGKDSAIMQWQVL